MTRILKINGGNSNHIYMICVVAIANFWFQTFFKKKTSGTLHIMFKSYVWLDNWITLLDYIFLFRSLAATNIFVQCKWSDEDWPF